MNLLRKITRFNPTKKSMKSNYEVSDTIKGQLDFKKVYRWFSWFLIYPEILAIKQTSGFHVLRKPSFSQRSQKQKLSWICSKKSLSFLTCKSVNSNLFDNIYQCKGLSDSEQDTKQKAWFLQSKKYIKPISGYR